jgi:hypothetical protein
LDRTACTNAGRLDLLVDSFDWNREWLDVCWIHVGDVVLGGLEAMPAFHYAVVEFLV